MKNILPTHPYLFVHSTTIPGKCNIQFLRLTLFYGPVQISQELSVLCWLFYPVNLRIIYIYIRCIYVDNH